MSEWLAKPRITADDIHDSIPSIVDYFPILTRFYVDNYKMRLSLPLPYELSDDLVAAVKNRFGEFTPTNLQQAALEALTQWAEKNRNR